MNEDLRKPVTEKDIEQIREKKIRFLENEDYEIIKRYFEMKGKKYDSLQEGFIDEVIKDYEEYCKEPPKFYHGIQLGSYNVYAFGIFDTFDRLKSEVGIMELNEEYENLNPYMKQKINEHFTQKGYHNEKEIKQVFLEIIVATILDKMERDSSIRFYNYGIGKVMDNVEVGIGELELIKTKMEYNS